MPLFQSESKCETISYDFDLHENETASRAHFHIMKGFALAWTRFETEAQENSEMAYS